jgi:hypothetical protein
VAVTVVPLVCLVEPSAHAASIAEVPGDTGHLEHPAPREHLQIVGQSEVVFVSVVHGFHGGDGGYETAMRWL